MKYNFDVINKARAIPLRATEKSTLLVLCFHASIEDATCFPCYETIKNESGACDKTIKDALELLKKMEVISYKNRASISKGKDSNLYKITFELPYSLKLIPKKGGGLKMTKGDRESFKSMAMVMRNEVKKERMARNGNPANAGRRYPTNTSYRKSQNLQMQVRGTSLSEPSTVTPQTQVVALRMLGVTTTTEVQSSVVAKKEERKNKESESGELLHATASEATKPSVKEEGSMSVDDSKSCNLADFSEYEGSTDEPVWSMTI